MTPESILEDHKANCQALYDQLLEENRIAKREKSFPNKDFFEKKQQLIEKLDASLADLKTIPSGQAKLKDSIEACHAQLMKILYLSRENEQILLNLTRIPRNESVAKPTSSAQVKRAYGN